jgi:hypothetical protein
MAVSSSGVCRPSPRGLVSAAAVVVPGFGEWLRSGWVSGRGFRSTLAGFSAAVRRRRARRRFLPETGIGLLELFIQSLLVGNL